ncbi:MAG TPA: response regulator, partial [Rubrobacteraceae bacterium]|nr:response regulator [Rubrobacteraceae bacterium]
MRASERLVMVKNAPIRVILADDHTMFRQGLKEMLATDGNIEVVGEAENGAQALELARETSPDVVILDVDMPVMGAREVLKRLIGLTPRPKVIIVTMYDDPRFVRELLGLGASAYLVKSASLEELLAAVHTAVQSPEEPQDENVILVLPHETLEKIERGTDQRFSTRELEILLLLARELQIRAQAEERRRISRELHDRVAHSMGVVHQSLELHEALKERDPPV